MPENEQKSWKDKLVNWAIGQPLTNQLLVAILLAIGFGGRWAATVAIPAHLKQIQDGYRDLATEMQDRHQTERAEAIRTYDRWIEWIREDNASRKGKTVGDASPSMMAAPDTR